MGRTSRARLVGAAVAVVVGLGSAPLAVQAGLAAPVGIDDTGPTTPCPVPNPYCFLPATVTIDAGGTVTWTSNSSNTHTVTADDGSWGSYNLDRGQTYQHTFTTGGSFTYHCQYHSFMTGKVVVNGSTTSTTTAAPPATSTHATTTTTTSTRSTTTTTSSAAATTASAQTAASASSPAPVAAASAPATSLAPGSSSTSGDLAGVAAGAQGSGSGGSGGAVIAIVVVVLVAGGAGTLWLRRRTAA